ncbi:MAG: TauD/TfdA family dioxygenase [Woeseia sp.]|nr:TauD/TfdA family dioxygenase [Woeseia sp.]
MAISSRPLTPSGFGLELRCSELSKLGKEDLNAVLDDFHEAGGLLLVRNQQQISHRQLVDFVGIFGQVELNEKYNPAFLEPSYPELLRIGNTKQNGEYTALFIKADPPPLMWHTDDSFRHPQPAGSCLFCVHTPPEGAATGFAGMHASYEALPEKTRHDIDEMEAIHSYDYLNELLRIKSPHRPPLSEELKQQIPPIVRPLVAQHPVSKKKGLYLPVCHIMSILGLAEEEARPLLNELQRHMTQPSFTHMHNWQPGDLVIWDNRSALHAPTPFDDDKHKRLMYRLTFGGEQIVGF